MSARGASTKESQTLPALEPITSVTIAADPVPALLNRSHARKVLMSPTLVKASKETTAKFKPELLPWAPEQLKKLRQSGVHDRVLVAPMIKHPHLPQRHTQLHRKLKKLFRDSDGNNANALMWAAKLMKEKEILCQACMVKCKRSEIMIKLINWHLDQNPSFVKQFIMTFSETIIQLLSADRLVLRQIVPDKLLERHLSADFDRLPTLLQRAPFPDVLAADLAAYTNRSLAPR
jgi:hypothetical protein